MKKTLIILAIFALSSSLVSAKDFRAELTFSYFSPSEEAYKDIYGGGLMFGGEVNMDVWKNLDAWISVSFFSREGEMTYTQEEIKLKITPIVLGVRYSHALNENINIYGGMGIAYFMYSEEISALEDVSEGGLGFVIKAGGWMKVMKGLFVDVFIKYSSCSVEPADFKVNIGGIEVGLGLGYEFKK
ncbi:outer membrane beta-barrel protein [Acidobacteriota bacterium]